MKKLTLIILGLLLLSLTSVNADVSKNYSNTKKIQNLSDYFQYLPNEVHNNWTPYKASKDYEVTVEFSIKKNGEISSPTIVKSTNPNANASVLNAVNAGAPYEPLPVSYLKDSVKAQIELKYIK